MTVVLDAATQILVLLGALHIAYLGANHYKKTNHLVYIADVVAGLYIALLYCVLLWHTINETSPIAWRFAVRMAFVLLGWQLIWHIRLGAGISLGRIWKR